MFKLKFIVCFLCLSVLFVLYSSCTNKKDSTAGKGSIKTNDTLIQNRGNSIDPSKFESPAVMDEAINQTDINEKTALSIIHTSLDTRLLFGTWTIDPNGPHADFVLSKKSYYIVDYDGDGDMRYELEGNDLKIYFKDFVQKGKILSVDRDSLKINWENAEKVQIYVRWKQ